MAFPATITLTLNAVAKVLNRINQDNYGSTYSLKSATESFLMQIRHSQDNPKDAVMPIDRHNVFVERTIYATPVTAEEYYSFTGTLRQYEESDPVKTGYLAAACVDWLDTAGVITDLSSGIN
nr:MAG: hypothetical protein 2 [Leviviridae sp.]